MKNKRYGVIVNPNGVQVSTGETLHYGQTLDIIEDRKFHDCKGYTVQPHGFDSGPFALSEADVRVTS